MKISCIDKEVKAVLESGYYKVPRFQRPYSWDRENVDEFWADSIADSGSEYFIGSMVVFRDSSDLYGVVDGQQRLTTITMVLCAVREAYLQIHQEDLAKGVHRYVERADLSNVPQYILQTETSYPYLQEHIQKYGQPDADPEIGPEEKSLQTAYRHIFDKVVSAISAVENDTTLADAKREAAVLKKLAEIRDKVLRLKLIFVEVDEEDDAYIIFETLNTRGKDLTVSDLVKNHLLKNLKQGNKKVDLPKDKWNSILESFEVSQADISVSSFLHHFWLSRYEFTTEKKLFKMIKKRVKKADAAAFLDTLADEAQLYRQIHEPKFRDWSKDEFDLRDGLEALNLFRVKQPIPMVLSLMREFDAARLKVKHVREMLQAIESFHFVFTAITSQRSSGGVSHRYASHARGLFQAADATAKLASLRELRDKLREGLPTYSEFRIEFPFIRLTDAETKQKKLVQYILNKIDQHHSGGAAIDYERMTVEHLFPLANASSPAERRAVGMIGNLLLVDRDLNNKLADKSFSQKKAMLTKDKRIWVDDHIKGATSWGHTEIEKRTEALGKLAYERIWRV